MHSKIKTNWFEESRFGMFIHWGIYAIPAKGEWHASIDKITNEEYQTYFEEFNPVKYDPYAWAKAAKNAGMKYAVLTAKHHDGFCLFDSDYTDYKATNTPAGRDLIKEYVEAFRNEGLKVGLYYSLLDWHHPDYPAYNDPYHPMRGNESYKNQSYNFENYINYMHNQVRELCTNYGKVDLMWFDFSYEGKSGEDWHATKLVEMVRSLQPDILINSRLEASGENLGSLLSKNPSSYSGDFATPEQIIPPYGLRDTDGKRVVWESCNTLNNSWGYCEGDSCYKPASTCIRKLVECVSKGGNMLLNVGPDALGVIPQRSIDILAEIGTWMDKNGPSIYGCHSADIETANYRLTAKGNYIYLHITEQPIGPVPVIGINKENIVKARLLSTGSKLKVAKEWAASNYPDTAFIVLGKQENETYPLADEIDTVVKIEVK